MTQEAVQLVAVAGLAVSVLALLFVLLLAWRVRRLARRGAAAPTVSGADVGPTLERAVARLAEVGAGLDDVRNRLPGVEERAARAVQRVGVVRFNPFEDTGSNQSFALALLDSRGDGVVISSLHSRQQTRIYLKSIVGGKCETALSEEEAEALRQAGVS
ncbi:MAG: DUF4446 family protein [Chloroflexota bacterium]|nr:DUF4446 family protein [Chloroflexota bacterium]